MTDKRHPQAAWTVESEDYFSIVDTWKPRHIHGQGLAECLYFVECHLTTDFGTFYQDGWANGNGFRNWALYHSSLVGINPWETQHKSN